jgi:hypothetical protein
MLWPWIGKVQNVLMTVALSLLTVALVTGVVWLAQLTFGQMSVSMDVALTFGIVMGSCALTMILACLKLHAIGVIGPRFVEWARKRSAACRTTANIRGLCGVFAGPSKQGIRKWRKHSAGK